MGHIRSSSTSLSCGVDQTAWILWFLHVLPGFRRAKYSQICGKFTWSYQHSPGKRIKKCHLGDAFELIRTKSHVGPPPSWLSISWALFLTTCAFLSRLHLLAPYARIAAMVGWESQLVVKPDETLWIINNWNPLLNPTESELPSYPPIMLYHVNICEHIWNTSVIAVGPKTWNPTHSTRLPGFVSGGTKNISAASDFCQSFQWSGYNRNRSAICSKRLQSNSSGCSNLLL